MAMTFDEKSFASDADLVRMMKGVVKATAPRVLKRAVEKAPVDTGSLAKSGRVGRAVAEGAGASIEITFGADYAAPVNNGHLGRNGKFVAPQPFLNDGLREGAADLEDEAARALEAMGARVTRF